MFAGDDHLVGHAVGVGEAFHLAEVQATDAGGGGQRQGGRGTGGDIARLGPGDARNEIAGGCLKLIHGDAFPGGLRHRLHRLIRHQGTAQAGCRSSRVDDGR